ncbi:MAG: GNAT family N-acetyltransferase [Actinomycetota bacterium]|nr:GNAT family N-acetyltransferase [Actinomycetota bacterium]
MTISGWPIAVPTLTDGSVMLRGWADHDADAVYAACQNAEIQRWMDVPVPYLLEHAIQFVGEHSAEQWSSQTGAPFAITCAANGGVLGSCGLVNVDGRHLVAEVVCAVAPSARRGRVAQRAVGILCEWAFREVGMARLEFYIESGNAASRAVAERVGGRHEGLLRNKVLIGESRHDMAIPGGSLSPEPNQGNDEHGGTC